MINDDSIDELLAELSSIHWDIVAISETWRTEKQELWHTTRGNRLFAGSGHDSNTRGVAFLIHSRWVKQLRRFCPVNERVAYINIDIYAWKLRVVAAYFHNLAIRTHTHI